MRADVLVVEPAADTCVLIAGLLAQASCTVRTAGDGRSALAALVTAPADVVVLALNLPDVDGLDVLRRLKVTGDTRVVIVSARATEGDRVSGFDAGADDYITKPFSGAELVARVRAQLRLQARQRDTGRVECAGLVIDLDSREVTVDGRPVALRHLEFDLLCFLALSPGQVFSRVQLLERVWGSSDGWQSEATVTEHIRRIRDQIEADPRSPRWIHTVHRVGYRFERGPRTAHTLVSNAHHGRDG